MQKKKQQKAFLLLKHGQWKKSGSCWCVVPALSGDWRFHEKPMKVTSVIGRVSQLLLSQVTENWETLLIVASRNCYWGFDLLTKKRNPWELSEFDGTTLDKNWQEPPFSFFPPLALSVMVGCHWKRRWSVASWTLVKFIALLFLLFKNTLKKLKNIYLN
jgi:hypothetical protein